MNNNNTDERYWGLPALAYLIRWLMELVALLSKPLLMIGAGVSVLVFLTDGSVLSIPLIYYGWALIQAIAVEALFYVIWHDASKAWKARRPLVFAGNLLLGSTLAIVVWAAIDLQSLQQSLRIGNSDALAILNLNPVMLTHLRALAAVVLSIVAAMRSVENRNVNTVKGKMKLNIKWPKFLLNWYGKLLSLLHANEDAKSENVAIEKAKVATENLPVESENVEVENVTTLHETLHVNSEQFAPELSIENQVEDVIPFDWKLSETPPHLLHFPVIDPGIESVKPAQVKSEKKRVKPKSNLHVVKSTEKSPESIVRAAYDKHPDVTIADLVRITNLSRPTIKKWKDIIDSERQRIETAI